MYNPAAKRTFFAKEKAVTVHAVEIYLENTMEYLNRNSFFTNTQKLPVSNAITQTEMCQLNRQRV